MVDFRSTKWLGQITCPVLILHPEDDATIPAELSRKLYDEAKKDLITCAELAPDDTAVPKLMTRVVTKGY